MTEVSTKTTDQDKRYEVCLSLNVPDLNEPSISRGEWFQKLKVLSDRARNELEWWFASTGIDVKILKPDGLSTPLLFIECPQALIDLLSSDGTKPEIVKEFAVQDVGDRVQLELI